ncbi:hypothetical protein [Streptomyces sp. NBC_00435]|uniref:hypothetical protein n=1 Tax=Streptomyces sp. NBC_00435 TaxID=2903649 RepID=UPI002E229864
MTGAHFTEPAVRPETTWRSVDHRGLFELHRDGTDVRADDPHCERQVEGGVGDGQHGDRVEQSERLELAVEAHLQRRRLEHLGDQDEQQEGGAPAEAHPGRAVRGGQRHQDHQSGRTAGDQQGVGQVLPQGGVRPDPGEGRPVEVGRKVAVVPQFT